MASNTASPNNQVPYATNSMANSLLNEQNLASHQKSKLTDCPASPLNHSTPPVGLPTQQGTPRGDSKDREMNGLSRGVQALHLAGINDDKANLEASADDTRSKSEGAFDDDQTHLSGSSTKPTSFDSKSMASVTTFAMDEKESLRPDDSASVQAIEEDDLSGSASGAPISHVGSDRCDRAKPVSNASISQLPTGNDMASIPLQNLHCDPSATSLNEPALHGFPNEPDEKLLEAMNSPKDRLLILQLEEKIIAFIKTASEQSLELPQCNAFGRLLGHKLGDYYHLTHFVDNNVTSVRLHRTPWCRLPTPLSTLYAATAMKTPPPTMPAMKIMRRAGQVGNSASIGGSTAPSSSAPSKPTSEVGADGSGEDGTESSTAATPAKDRQALTREEREAKYQEARERIFRDFPESKSSDSPNSGELSAEVSRSNSRTGRKKHKQRTPHDDSFEARSQFTSTYYGGVQYTNPTMPFGGVMQETGYISQNGYMMGQSISTGMNFPHNNPATAVYLPQHTTAGGFSHYPMPMSTQGNWQSGHIPAQYTNFHQGNQSSVMSQPSPTRSSPAMNSYALPTGGIQYSQSLPAWTPTPYQPNYPSPPSQRSSQTVHWPNVPSHPMNTPQPPYSFGQHQNQAYPQMPPNSGPPHLLPGSFVRSTFNPQSRSFAPTTGMVQSSQAPNAYSVPQPWTGQQEQRFQPKNISAHASSKSSSTSSGHGGRANPQNSIAKWGTPAHLPPKPPPSEVPYDFNTKTRPATVPTQPYMNSPSTASKSTPPKPRPLVVGGTPSQNTRSQ